MARSVFTVRIIEVIRAIPSGKVSTYGEVAELAGNPQGARQVVRVLHSCSETENLPWHRVVNRLGRIALGPFDGFDRQKELLEAESVEFDDNDQIDLNRFRWRGDLDALC